MVFHKRKQKRNFFRKLRQPKNCVVGKHSEGIDQVQRFVGHLVKRFVNEDGLKRSLVFAVDFFGGSTLVAVGHGIECTFQRAPLFTSSMDLPSGSSQGQLYSWLESFGAQRPLVVKAESDQVEILAADPPLNLRSLDSMTVRSTSNQASDGRWHKTLYATGTHRKRSGLMEAANAFEVSPHSGVFMYHINPTFAEAKLGLDVSNVKVVRHLLKALVRQHKERVNTREGTSKHADAEEDVLMGRLPESSLREATQPSDNHANIVCTAISCHNGMPIDGVAPLWPQMPAPDLQNFDLNNKSHFELPLPSSPSSSMATPSSSTATCTSSPYHSIQPSNSLCPHDSPSYTSSPKSSNSPNSPNYPSSPKSPSSPNSPSSPSSPSSPKSFKPPSSPRSPSSPLQCTYPSSSTQSLSPSHTATMASWPSSHHRLTGGATSSPSSHHPHCPTPPLSPTLPRLCYPLPSTSHPPCDSLAQPANSLAQPSDSPAQPSELTQETRPHGEFSKTQLGITHDRVGHVSKPGPTDLTICPPSPRLLSPDADSPHSTYYANTGFDNSTNGGSSEGTLDALIEDKQCQITPPCTPGLDLSTPTSPALEKSIKTWAKMEVQSQLVIQCKAWGEELRLPIRAEATCAEEEDLLRRLEEEEGAGVAPRRVREILANLNQVPMTLALLEESQLAEPLAIIAANRLWVSLAPIASNLLTSWKSLLLNVIHNVEKCKALRNSFIFNGLNNKVHKPIWNGKEKRKYHKKISRTLKTNKRVASCMLF